MAHVFLVKRTANFVVSQPVRDEEECRFGNRGICDTAEQGLEHIRRQAGSCWSVGYESLCELVTNYLPGGYDPRLEDNIRTLKSLIELAQFNSLTYNVITPSQSRVTVPTFPKITSNEPDILFLLNFTTSQRSGLLQAQSTVALLYTPANEHFGIGPVEGMICGLPILACDSGGPTESIVDQPAEQRTGWLYSPQPSVWAQALEEICNLSETDTMALSQRARDRAQKLFGMKAMAKSLEEVLQDAVSMGPVSRTGMWLVIFACLGLLAALIVRYGSFSG
jgi:alpha-1,3/alpha-1,6-mannosyltransferase